MRIGRRENDELKRSIVMFGEGFTWEFVLQSNSNCVANLMVYVA